MEDIQSPLAKLCLESITLPLLPSQSIYNEGVLVQKITTYSNSGAALRA